MLLMRVGGHGGTGAAGIHGRHLDGQARIRYFAADERRQTIPRVLYVDDDGRTVEYVSEDAAAGAPAGTEREMDCVDCHNRPTHAFELPHRAIDRLIEEGRISRELPFVRKKAVELLRGEYRDREAAAREIGERLASLYRSDYPELAASRGREIEAAIEAVREAYLRNVFPAMKVGWGTHPNNIGHEDFPGCFRCHDDKHKSKDGRAIAQDCESCHAILAMEESNPKLLSELGLR